MRPIFRVIRDQYSIEWKSNKDVSEGSYRMFIVISTSLPSLRYLSYHTNQHICTYSNPKVSLLVDMELIQPTKLLTCTIIRY